MKELIKTVVKVNDLNYEGVKYLYNVTNPTRNGNVEQLELINRVYNTRYEWDLNLKKSNWPSGEFLENAVGSKYVSINDAVIDDNDATITFESEDNIPLPLIKRILLNIRNFNDECNMNIVKTYT